MLAELSSIENCMTVLLLCSKSNPKKKPKNIWCYGSVVLLGLLVVVIVLGIGLGIGLNFGLQNTSLPSRITTSNLMTHLKVRTARQVSTSSWILSLSLSLPPLPLPSLPPHFPYRN